MFSAKDRIPFLKDQIFRDEMHVQLVKQCHNRNRMDAVQFRVKNPRSRAFAVKHACEITHPQIVSGACPWCQEVLGDSDVMRTTTVTVWNVPAMSHALTAPEEDVRMMTVTNLRHSGLTADVVVALFSMALSDSSDRIRSSAEHGLSRCGRSMTLDEAQQFEALIPGAKHELALRILLLAYYSIRQRESKSCTMRHAHIYWFIRNAPDSNSAGSPDVSIHRWEIEQAYVTAKGLWLDQVGLHPENTTILGNAAHFFILRDWQLSEELLDRASRLEPNNPEWHNRLAHLYSLHSKRESPSRQIILEKAFREQQIAAQLEKAAEGDTNEMAAIAGLNRLPELAKSAYEAGHFQEAHNYATELLELVDSSEASEDVFPTGNAVHFGNLVLGRLALKKGDTEQAKLHLLAAGRTTGSPQLNSFGPNMTLAKELLELGEREVVLEYFQLCEKFWKHHSEQLEEWTEAVTAGQVPAFGANLVY